jgi:hypothetical protein
MESTVKRTLVRRAFFEGGGNGEDADDADEEDDREDHEE